MMPVRPQGAAGYVVIMKVYSEDLWAIARVYWKVRVRYHKDGKSECGIGNY
jgi:hypothetical protein